MTPFSLPDWPSRCGFEYDPKRRRWVKGDFYLVQHARTKWKLHRGEDDVTGVRVETTARKDDAVAEDLARRLRELTEAR